MDSNLLRSAIVGPKSAIIEYLISKDVDAAVLDRIFTWDDGIERRATALIYYKRLREMALGRKKPRPNWRRCSNLIFATLNRWSEAAAMSPRVKRSSADQGSNMMPPSQGEFPLQRKLKSAA
jgi:hypothetical protein